MSRHRPVLALAWAHLRGSRGTNLLMLVAVVLASSLTVMGVITNWSTSRAFSATQRALDAPDLLVSLTPGEEARGLQSLRQAAGVQRLQQQAVEASGSISSAKNPQRVSAAIRVEWPGLPSWVRLIEGSGSAGGAVLERGYARKMSASLGSRVTVVGPSGSVELPVTGIAGDLSRATYPMSGQSTIVYLDGQAGQRLGIGGGADRLWAVWASAGTDPHLVAQRASDLAQAAGLELNYHVMVETAAGLSVVLELISAIVVVFAVAAFVCLIFFLVGGTRLRILRGWRRLGQQLAMGFTVRQIRWMLLMERLPVVLVAGAIGGGVGVAGGRWAAARSSELFGAAPELGVAPAAVAGVLVVLVLIAWGSIAWGTRALRRRTPAGLMRGAPTGRASRRAGLRRPGGPVRIGRVLATGHPGRAALVISMGVLALITSVFAVGALSTLDAMTKDPGLYGRAYDDEVSLSSTADTAAAAATARKMPGVAVAEPIGYGYVRVNDRVRSVELRMVPAGSGLLTPTILSGKLPARDGEVAVGRAIAAQLELSVGQQITLADNNDPTRVAHVTVSGIIRPFGRSKVMIGTLALSAFQSPRATPGILVRATPGAGDLAPALARLDNGRAVVTRSSDAIDLPFAGLLRGLIASLAAGLVLLSAVIALNTAVTCGAEQVSTFSLIRSIGASPRDQRRLGSAYALVITAPAVVLGGVLGLFLTDYGLRKMMAKATQAAPLLPPWQLGAVTVAITAALYGALRLPIVLSAQRAPASGMRRPS